MKLSLSIPDEDVEFLDAYASSRGSLSRSAVVQYAIRTMRAIELADDYESAFSEWDEGGEQDLWDNSASDGLPT